MCNLSNEKTQYSFILNYKGVGEEVWKEQCKKGLNKWNQGKIIEILMWVILFWWLSLITIKWDQREFFPKIGKWLTPTTKDKKAIYSKASFKLWIEKKCAIDLIPVKSYKKGFLFLLELTLKYITNNSLQLAKLFSQ